MTDRFTATQWGRILSAHAGGQLIRAGYQWTEESESDGACIVQAAHEVPSPEQARSMDSELADLFDCSYDPAWTVEELIAWVDSVPR